MSLFPKFRIWRKHHLKIKRLDFWKDDSWYFLSAGGGMLGLSSLKPGSDGQWPVTHISCHSGIFFNHFYNSLKAQINCCCPEVKSDTWWLPSSLSDLVTDMDFSPFDESLLATCSADETVSCLLTSLLLSDLLHSFEQVHFSILSGFVVPGGTANHPPPPLFKPFEDSPLSAYCLQPQVPRLAGMCWASSISAARFTSQTRKHMQVLPHARRRDPQRPASVCKALWLLLSFASM